MVVIVTNKNKKDPNKYEVAGVAPTFPHYNPMGATCCHRNQSSDLMQAILNPVMLHVKFNRSWFYTTCGEICI